MVAFARLPFASTLWVAFMPSSAGSAVDDDHGALPPVLAVQPWSRNGSSHIAWIAVSTTGGRRAGTRHDGVHRDLLCGDRALPDRLEADDLVLGDVRPGERLRDALLGRRDDRQAVGPAVLLVEPFAASASSTSRRAARSVIATSRCLGPRPRAVNRAG
jgi:hypothetical protein